MWYFKNLIIKLPGEIKITDHKAGKLYAAITYPTGSNTCKIPKFNQPEDIYFTKHTEKNRFVSHHQTNKKCTVNALIFFANHLIGLFFYCCIFSFLHILVP